VCVQSHLFIIQLVHRPTVKSAVCSVLSQRLVIADQSVAKSELKSALSTRKRLKESLVRYVSFVKLPSGCLHCSVIIPCRPPVGKAGDIATYSSISPSVSSCVYVSVCQLCGALAIRAVQVQALLVFFCFSSFRQPFSFNVVR